MASIRPQHGCISRQPFRRFEWSFANLHVHIHVEGLSSLIGRDARTDRKYGTCWKNVSSINIRSSFTHVHPSSNEMSRNDYATCVPFGSDAQTSPESLRRDGDQDKRPHCFRKGHSESIRGACVRAVEDAFSYILALVRSWDVIISHFQVLAFLGNAVPSSKSGFDHESRVFATRVIAIFNLSMASCLLSIQRCSSFDKHRMHRPLLGIMPHCVFPGSIHVHFVTTKSYPICSSDHEGGA